MNQKPFALALVTGASSGIGEALCDLLAEKNIHLMIHGRNHHKLVQLATKWRHKVDVEIVFCELNHAHERQILIDKIHRSVPDLVINNAGFGLYGEALTYQTKEQMEILEVNGNAVLEISLEASRALISAYKEGVIMNIASAAAMQIFPCLAVYAATKAFVTHFSQSLDEELRSKGVRMLAACPGMVTTDFRSRAGGIPDSQKQMSPSFAAQEIWKQIEKRKPIHVFNWKYRVGTFLTRYVLPKRWIVPRLRANIDARHPPRKIIKCSVPKDE